MTNQKSSFHWTVRVWLWLCVIVWAAAFLYNIYDIVAGVIRGDHVGLIWRAIFSITIFSQYCICMGYAGMLFQKEKKGFWEAMLYPFGAGILSVAILLIWGGPSGNPFVMLIPTMLIPGGFILITYGILQIRQDGVRAWDLLD